MTPKRFTLSLALAGFVAAPVWAAGLGKLTVNSSLGQPLSAEIEIYADQKELDSLSAGSAAQGAYANARITPSPVLSQLRFAVERRSGGRAVLKLSTAKPVNDPFVDVLIDLSWADGQLTREYTLLIDPPEYRAAQAARAPRAPAVAAPSARAPAQASADTGADAVVVRRGETLGEIGMRVRPEGVNLDQTLVGLFRANPRAFEGGNMNRLKAGARLKVPGASELAATAAPVARREVLVQSEDWRAYRSRLADAVESREASVAPEAATSGTPVPKVVDAAKPPAGAAADVLSLSRAGTPGAQGELETQLQAQEADAIAREKALAESSERIAMLEKQIADMQTLLEKQQQQAAQPGAESAVAPAAASPLTNPLYWLGGALLLAFGGLLWWKSSKRAQRPSLASAYDEPGARSADVPPNPYTANTVGGGKVDTGETSALLTDFSQTAMGAIDTHDVDPVAEADVYIAYGRDAQAEEILKDALAKQPERHEVRMKLLEIYAARRNVLAFEAQALDLQRALGDTPGEMWEEATRMGREIDPSNPLYGTGGAAAPATGPGVVAAAGGVVVAAAAAANAAAEGGVVTPPAADPPAPPALDLSDLEFDLGGGKSAADNTPKLDTGEVDDTPFDNKFDFSGLDLDLGDQDGQAEVDEVGTKLDLARAYFEMGDKDGAREILGEVLREGNPTQIESAQALLAKL